MSDIVYIELNHWSPGTNYPDCEPYLTWMSDEVLQFRDDKWLRENKIIAVETLIDMSCNFCITAPRKWVEKNCNDILTTYTEFLRQPDEDGKVYGQFGCVFKEYTKENLGYWYAGWDELEEPKRVNEEWKGI